MVKKLSLVFLLIGFWTLDPAFAQDTRMATLKVNATARVSDNLQMLTIRNLDLINPVVVENRIHVSPITSSYAGLFKIIGNPNARVRITFLRTETIREQLDGMGEVFAEYFLSAAREDIQLQSLLLDLGETVLSVGNRGELYIWLGVNLQLDKASPGLYLSEFIIELEYI